VVEFTNGTSIEEGASSANKEQVWALQLEWLIRRHFDNQRRLKPKGIKNLSLIFIDKVANYMSTENPVIKKIFEQQYKTVFAEFHNGQIPSDEQVKAVQGFYFAKTSTGEFTDNEKTNKSNKEIYDEILHNKQKLLSFDDSTIEFVFSHSALGVGWDNPNVFGIATLNESYSENKKRQEIGRGLRICVNQQGERVYDAVGTPDDEVINQLTVVPNETYETFARSYQIENEKAFGKSSAGAKLRHTHKGKPQNRVTFKLNKDEGIQNVFRRFWNTIAKKTTYRVSFDEDAIIRRSIEELNTISIAEYKAEVSSYRVGNIEDLSQREYMGSEDRNLKGHYSPQDLVEDLSEKTGLCYNSILRIVQEIETKKEYLKNPPVFLEQAAFKIKQVQLEELVRCVKYNPTDEVYPFDFADFTKDACDNYVSTPNHGIWDKTLYDSGLERDFAVDADKIENQKVVCFLKFPSWYTIPTPIGEYEPDFGVVLKRVSLRDNQDQQEYYFVVEIKGTNDITDKRALTPHEIARINCAIKHFRSLGIEAVYKAPIREYSTFKAQAEQTINTQANGNI
jgi:type III restriction enzyme